MGVNMNYYIFHHNDLDGRCAAYVVLDYLKNNMGVVDPIIKENSMSVSYPIIQEIDYNHLNELTSLVKEEGSIAYLVDISFTEETYKYLLDLKEKCEGIVWIDHHYSSQQLVNNHPEIISLIPGVVNMDFCGAYNTYTYLYKNKEVPLYIRLVDDWDCWKFKFEDTKAFKFGMDSVCHGPESPIWETLQNEDKVSLIITRGYIIMQYMNRFYEGYYNNSYERTIDGLRACILNLKTNSMAFLDNQSKYDLLVAWVFDGYKFNYSLYSTNPDVNCAEIAERFGGGGHKGAAGFSSKTQVW